MTGNTSNWPADSEGRISVLIEIRVQPGATGSFAKDRASAFDVPGFRLDHEFEPVPMGGSGASGSGETYMVRGTVADESEIEALRAQPDVAEVWPDTPIAPFSG